MFDPAKADFENTPVALKRPVGSFAPADLAAPPAVSIVTPYFSPGPVFLETHQSVLRQSLQQWEWIIVDDASPDPESQAQLSELADSDPRIHVVKLAANVGRSAARNTGIANARSDFVFTLDHDDLLEATAIEKSLWFLAAHCECGFVNGWSVAFGAKQFLWSHGFDPADVFLERNVVSGRALIRKSVLDEVGGYDAKIVDSFEDWDLWMRCADHGIWGATIPEYLDWFRRREPPADWEAPGRAEAFRQGLRVRYPALWDDGMPRLAPAAATPLAPETTAPCTNDLAPERRLLVAMDGTCSDPAIVPCLEELAAAGWRLTLVAASATPQIHACAAFAADLHVADRFLCAADLPSFIAYLQRSRRPAAVLTVGLPFALALLPFLASQPPRTQAPPLFAAWIDGVDPISRDEWIATRGHADVLVVASDERADALRNAGLDAEPLRVSSDAAFGDWLEEELRSLSGKLPSAAERGGPVEGAEAHALVVACCRLLAATERNRGAHGEALQRLEEQSSLLRDLTQWGQGLSEARRWFEDQRDTWKAIADERHEQVEEQSRWIETLQEASEWYEEQRRHWMTLAERRGGELERSDSEHRDEAPRMSERFEGLMAERDALAARIAALEDSADREPLPADAEE